MSAVLVGRGGRKRGPVSVRASEFGQEASGAHGPATGRSSLPGVNWIEFIENIGADPRQPTLRKEDAGCHNAL